MPQAEVSALVRSLSAKRVTEALKSAAKSRTFGKLSFASIEHFPFVSGKQ
jgi:hypothetical protein